MKPKTRSLTGMLALIAGLTLYALAVMQLGGPLSRLPWAVEAAVYLVLGIVWIVPARALFRWMMAAHQDTGG